MDRNASPAFEVLRPSSRRLLTFIEQAIERAGGPVSLYADQLATIGSARIIRPGMSELHALGLIEAVRLTKRYECRLSYRWRDVRSMREAMLISIRARVRPMPPQPPQTQAATAHA
jgi:hypothetical protein